MGAVAYLQIREILSGKKIWLTGLLAGFPVLLALVVAQAGGWREAGPELQEFVKVVFLFILYPMVVAILLTLLYGTAILNSELERKTVTYLFTRPVPKWKIIVGKYLAIVGFLSVPMIISVGAAWVVLEAPGGVRFLLGMELAAVGAIVAYTAIFAAIGTLFRGRPLVVGLVYAVISEGILSFIPALVNTVTVTYYLRSLAVKALGVKVPVEVARLVGGASLFESVAVLLVIAAVGLGVASVITTRREYSVADAV